MNGSDDRSDRPRALAAGLVLCAAFAACGGEKSAAPSASTEAPASKLDPPPAAEEPPPAVEEPSVEAAPAQEAANEAPDTVAEMRELLRRADAEPESMDAMERILLESLFLEFLPPTEGKLEGAEWQVLEAVGSKVAQLHLDLVRGSEQLVGIDVQFRPDAGTPEAPAYGHTTASGYPAIERSRFLFVRVGRVELRMEGRAEGWRSLEPLRELLALFPLERIASI